MTILSPISWIAGGLHGGFLNNHNKHSYVIASKFACGCCLQTLHTTSKSHFLLSLTSKFVYLLRKSFWLHKTRGGAGEARAPQIIGTLKISVLSTNTHSRFASIVLEVVKGPSCLERHTWQCSCVWVVSGATHKALRALEGRRVSSKIPQGSETETRELLGETEGNCIPLTKVIDLSSRQINDFWPIRTP